MTTNAPRALPYVKPLGTRTDTNRPIWQYDMPSAAWQLLWWLICKMDENGEVKGGWRRWAAGNLKMHEQWVGRCAQHLVKRNLLETQPRARWCKVRIDNLVG